MKGGGKVKVRSTRRMLLLTVLLLALLPLAWQTVAGTSGCEAKVTIYGQLLDEQGEPLAAEEVNFTFYVSPRSKDLEKTATTDFQGRFALEADIPQTVYRNSGYQAVELQARVRMGESPQLVAYDPGGRQLISEDGTYTDWAESGRYTTDHIQLFHSLRMADSPFANPRFADITVELGTVAEPCILQLESSGLETGDKDGGDDKDKDKGNESSGGNGSGGGGKPSPEPTPEPPPDPTPEPPPRPEPPPEETENPEGVVPPDESGPAVQTPSDPETPRVETAAAGSDEAPRDGTGNNPTTFNLTAAQREELRNITFVKWSYRQDAQPGEEITYGFAGFENAFPYALQKYVIVDEPDPGLDLLAIQLPAFKQGEGLTYDITYITNKHEERPLAQTVPADQPYTLNSPVLAADEYITEMSIRLEEVPPGFAKQDEIQMTFRIWADPPADVLHNQAFLYYVDQDEEITLQSNGGHAQVSIHDKKQAKQTPPIEGQTTSETQRNDLFHGGNKSLAKRLVTVLLIVMLALGLLIIGRRRRQSGRH